MYENFQPVCPVTSNLAAGRKIPLPYIAKQWIRENLDTANQREWAGGMASTPASWTFFLGKYGTLLSKSIKSLLHKLLLD